MNLSPLNTAAKYGSSVVQDVQGSAETEWSREVFHELDLNTMKALSDCGEQYLRNLYTEKLKVTSGPQGVHTVLLALNKSF